MQNNDQSQKKEMKSITQYSDESDDESETEKLQLNNNMNIYEMHLKDSQKPNLFKYEHKGVVIYEARARII